MITLFLKYFSVDGNSSILKCAVFYIQTKSVTFIDLKHSFTCLFLYRFLLSEANCSFLHLFNDHLLNIYLMPDTMLGLTTKL